MSFGFSPSDVLTGLQLSKFLWDTFFDKNNSADKRFIAFANDVKSFRLRLEELNDAFQNSLRPYDKFQSDATKIKSNLSLRELVGDFNDTLRQCQDILQKHGKSLRNGSGIFQNLVWATTVNDKVDVLRQRIQFHTQQVCLIIEPVSLGLLTTINDKVDQVIYLLKAQSPKPKFIPIIPEWLDTKFRKLLKDNPPSNFSVASQIPMKEGVEAFCNHFRESTYACRGEEKISPTINQYLNLLKCQWILDVLQKGDPYNQALPRSTRIVAQLEGQLLNEYERNLVCPSNDELQKLEDEAFLIWPPSKSDAEYLRNPMADANITEEEILKISLPSLPRSDKKESFLFFRAGPTELRIVRKITSDIFNTYYEGERFIDIHIDRFVPFYAAPQDNFQSRQSSNPATVFRVGIYRGNKNVGTYDFQDKLNVYAFQQAVTGYKVVSDVTTSWAIKHSGSSKPQKGKGGLQIWHWKPLTQEQSNRKDSLSSSSIKSPTRRMSMASNSTTIQKIIQEKESSMVSIHEHSTQGTTMTASTPPLPAIVIFNRDRDEYSYFHLELDFGLQIVPTACKCNISPHTCRRIVLEKRRPKSAELSFQIRRLSVHEDQISSWNLCLFAQPRHPDFNSSKHLQFLTCKYLNLDFNTIQDRDEFTMKFRHALFLRDKAEKEVKDIIVDTALLGEKPEDVSKGRRFSKMSMTSTHRESWLAQTTSLPEKLPVLPASRSPGLDSSDETKDMFSKSAPDLSP